MGYLGLGGSKKPRRIPSSSLQTGKQQIEELRARILTIRDIGYRFEA
jgi:hypothetical protein